MTATLLDQPLGDLRREIDDLRQVNILHDYNINKLSQIISLSRDKLHQTGNFQKQILQQLELFEISLADINQILRSNSEQKAQLEQKRQTNDNDFDLRAKIMALTAEALECRAVAVQLQQEAQLAIAKTAELERRANDELAQQALEMKIKQQEVERNRAAELERRVRAEEERQRIKDSQEQQKQSERSVVSKKNQQSTMPSISSQQQEQYANWIARDFMQDEQNPPCIIRLSPKSSSIPIEITFLKAADTEHLLDNQEELISTPLKVNFHGKINENEFILLAMPYLLKRTTHRENVIKIRQSNGLWISLETQESSFDSHKEKRFVQCQLDQSAACAVVSRLRRDTVLIRPQTSGRFLSTADPRLTMQWPKNVSATDLQLDLCVQPVELSIFNQFCQHYSHECQGLLAVGPIIDLNNDDISLLKPIQMTMPILVQGKKKISPAKVTIAEPMTPPSTSSGQPSQQEIILQQQQSIFRSMLGDDSSNERLVLLYSIDNTWHVDPDVRLNDSKTHDLISTNLQQLHGRMIIARCDKQLMSTKRLQTAISLLEESLNQRTVSFLLRRHSTDPHQICLVCCPTQRTEAIDQELQQENYSGEDEQAKEVVLQEGQLLELRFRGNVLPRDQKKQSETFVFNTYFPFYYESYVMEIDKFAQHLSSSFYGFIQIYSKQKVLRTINKDFDQKKKTSNEPIKQEWIDTDICLAELVVRLPKVPDQNAPVATRTLLSFPSEGILTPALFNDMSNSLSADEGRWLARRLGITRIRIEAIEHDYPDNTNYYLLLAWFKRVPRSSDKVALLIQALMNINRWDLAQILQTIKDEKRQEQKNSSKEDHLKLFRIPFNRICQRDECLRIWKQIARELTLTTDDILRIEQQYSSRQERCLRSLEAWALKDIRADVSTLARTIRSLGFKTLAREIEQLA